MDPGDLGIHSGWIVSPSGGFRGDILIHHGRIVAIGDPYTLPRAGENVDAEGLFVIPGLVDPHFHSRVPGFPQREDFQTASMAAAAGGVTTFLDMPNSLPPVNSVEIMREKVEIGERESCVDFGIIAGAGSDNLEQIPLLSKEGVVGFKTFLHRPPEGREEEFRGLCAENDGILLEVLKEIARSDSFSFIHAENAQITQHLTNSLRSKGMCTLEAFFVSRPPLAELEAVSRMLYYAEETKVALHLCHISTGRAMEIIKQAKEKGLNVSAETCPHYLVLTQEDVKHLGPYAKGHPPIRTRKDVEDLWEYISNGCVDMVGSDHCPYEVSEKEIGWDDIWLAPAGSPHAELTLPLMLDQVNRTRITIEKLVALLSENIARRFRLYPRKGAIQVGSDADLVLVDLKAKRKISRERMFTKARDTARSYEGMEVQGVPVMTIVRKVIMRDGRLAEDAFGWGEFVRPDG